MSLQTYRRKRDFEHTPEPRGGRHRKGKALSFVVQKHAARRLHYDFRLELDGTLKSWAVPKEPGGDEGAKRLAVHVEDHPLEYGKFEGDIPKGHYGAGHVDIWDNGIWIPHGDAARGYRKGHLSFELRGKRLHGDWDLVRMRTKEKADNWLLIPKGSGHAPMPEALSPQLATLVDTAPEGDDWLYEVKYDGYRMLARIEDGKARIYSRNGKDWTARFPRHAKELAKLPLKRAWLDGEMAVFEANGHTSFQKLQNALDAGDEADIRYAVFDLIFLNREDLRNIPLQERKRRLKDLLGSRSGLLFYSGHLEGRGDEVWRHACEHELEGVIGKRRTSPYRERRSSDWIKLKCRRGQELVIGGYTDPRGSRSGFGALLMGVRDEEGTLRYAGRVGSGFDERSLAALHKRLARLRQEGSPFRNAPRAKDVHWVKPELVAEVKFAGWTDEGLVRQGSFVGLREDKPARQVRKEKAVKPGTLADSVAGVKITHPDRVLFRKPSVTKPVTKLDLARYYESVAEWILPHLEDRPLSLVRCPQGPSGKCFFQRHAHGIMAERGKFIVADTLEAVIGLVQNGVIELHTWGSRARAPLRPDRMILDLDPDPALPWGKVVEGARLARTLLEELSLRSYLKTTGGKGLHLVVPLRTGPSWEDVKGFSQRIARHLEEVIPQMFTSTVSKAARVRRIFVDYLRNQEGATAVCAYSVRAREGATVSAPISWDELEGGVKPAAFDLRTIEGRLKRLRDDPWKDYGKHAHQLTKGMLARL